MDSTSCIAHCIPPFLIGIEEKKETQTLGIYSCFPRCNVLVRQVDACLSNLEINDRVYVLRPTWQGGDLLGGLDIGEYLITDHYDHKTHTMGYQTHAMGCHAIPIVQFFLDIV